MSIPFVDRPPTPQEIEKFRLILSTYQDGSGMLATKKSNRTLPGWRDFERSIAVAFNGISTESKDIFDVRLPDPERPGVSYGVSCKMRRELNRIDKDDRVTIELSNSARKFWAYLKEKGIDETNYKRRPFEVGVSLVELVVQWHMEASLERGGDVDLGKSLYLALSWSKDGWYQLHQFKLMLPNPAQLNWYFPERVMKGVRVLGSHINGDDSSGTLFEWYGESGAQLKYYPLAETAIWRSERFQLEPLPDMKYGVLSKAETYFPELWPK